MSSLRLSIFLILSCLCSNPLWANDLVPIQKGTSVEQVLRQFQMSGMKILYSSRLVHPEMLVESEPRADSARAMLDQVLNAHGLRISPGPEGTLLVVQDQESGPATKPVSKSIPTEFIEQVNVPFVTIYITARNGNNQFLTNLGPQHFVLKEDGVEQKITEFTNFADADEFPEDAEPLSVMMLVDSSASMNDVHAGKRKYDFVLEAGMQMVNQLNTPDQMMIMGFNQTPWVISELTPDKNVIREKLMTPVELSGRTALFDVLVEAVKRMDNFPGRRVLILCSDGQDSASKTSLNDLIKFLKSTDVTIFVLGTDDRRDFWHKGREVLKKISDASGGYAFHSSTESQLGSAMEKVRTTLRSQYAAGYIPPYPMVHKWRRVEIECKIPGVKLRYRGQYLF